MYLTQSHQSPTPHITHADKRWPVATLIARDDAETLAELGIYWHVTADGEAPLGYTDWTLIDNEYRREPAGTPEERQAAIDAQAAAAHEAYLDGLECTDLQAELELISRELWAPVQAWIDTQEATVQAYFRRSKTWKYRDPRLQAGASAMEMTDAQLIEILESARTL